MSRRTIAILLLILGLIVLSAVGIILITGQDDQPDETTTTEGEGAPPPDGQAGTPGAETAATPISEDTIGVVVSLQTVPRGHQMTEDILAIDRRPRDTVDSNVITNTQDVVGLFARTDIYQGQTLTTDKLASDIREISETQYGPSALIPPGFVAQAVPLRVLQDLEGDDPSIPSVGYGISEGDYVDILILFQMYQLDEEFQTLLPNSAAFFVEEFIQSVEESIADPESEEVEQAFIFTISPFGRFEQLPTGDLAHIGPREVQREFVIGMVIQNAKVVQVGQYFLPEPASASLATATPTPAPEGETAATAIPSVPTATPLPPDVVTIALQPQQQLLLRYAIEVGADIDFALRGINDTQLYAIENVDLDFILQRFNIELPPNFGFSVDQGDPFSDATEVTPTPPASSGGGEDN
jgi:Flp pilus assembly protein CpaB